MTIQCKFCGGFHDDVYQTNRQRMSELDLRFKSYVSPPPTVTCRCGWAGVGIQTKLHKLTDIEIADGATLKPRCPKCGKDNHLDWGKYKNSIKAEIKADELANKENL